MQASSEHSVCFAVPEKEVKAVAEALKSRFRQALEAGRLSQVFLFGLITCFDLEESNFLSFHMFLSCIRKSSNFSFLPRL